MVALPASRFRAVTFSSCVLYIHLVLNAGKGQTARSWDVRGSQESRDEHLCCILAMSSYHNLRFCVDVTQRSREPPRNRSVVSNAKKFSAWKWFSSPSVQLFLSLKESDVVDRLTLACYCVLRSAMSVLNPLSSQLIILVVIWSLTSLEL